MKKKWCAIGWVAVYLVIALGIQVVLSVQLVWAMYAILIKNGLFQDSAAVEGMLNKITNMTQDGGDLILISMLADLVMLACFGTWYYFRENQYTFRPDYKKAFTRKNVLCILGIGFFGQYAIEWIVVGIRALLPQVFKSYEELSQNFDLSNASPVFMVFSVCLFGPLVEEVVFRGMIYGKLRHNGFSIWVAAVISGIVFGAFHMNWVQGIYAAVFGVVLALVYEKTQTIWGSTLLHIAFNSSSYIVQFIDEQLMKYDSFSLSVFVVLFRIICVAVTVILIRQFRTERSGQRNTRLK